VSFYFIWVQSSESSFVSVFIGRLTQMLVVCVIKCTLTSLVSY